MAKAGRAQKQLPDAIKGHIDFIWRRFDEFARAAIAGLDESLDPAALLVCVSNGDDGRVEAYIAPAMSGRERSARVRLRNPPST